MRRFPTGVLFALALAFPVLRAMASSGMIDLSRQTVERRVGRGDQDKGLANANIWSPDGEWLVYDVSGDGEEDFRSERIEIVNIKSGAVEVLYQKHKGAGCGVASWSPSGDCVAFILGPENPSDDWAYAPSRRRGVIVRRDAPGEVIPIDAMNYAPPFVPGALRGGSHVHMFSPDGKWMSFTYDDEVLSRLDRLAASGNEVPAHDTAARMVAVAVSGHSVKVSDSHPRNHDGTWFSTVVTELSDNPRPGSDEISRAFEESWIGREGYVREDGSRQRRALTFQGLVAGRDGGKHAEVFVADLPEDIMKPGRAPLEGTVLRRPAPPEGVVQRRLTFTDNRKHPGLARNPRHWLKSSPDGHHIGYIALDDEGVAQFWTVSPADGGSRQVTTLKGSGLASDFSWHPSGESVAALVDGSLCLIHVESGRVYRLTKRSGDFDIPGVILCVVSPDGKHVAYQKNREGPARRVRDIFTVTIPASLPIPIQ